MSYHCHVVYCSPTKKTRMRSWAADDERVFLNQSVKTQIQVKDERIWSLQVNLSIIKPNLLVFIWVLSVEKYPDFPLKWRLTLELNKTNFQTTDMRVCWKIISTYALAHTYSYTQRLCACPFTTDLHFLKNRWQSDRERMMLKIILLKWGIMLWFSLWVSYWYILNFMRRKLFTMWIDRLKKQKPYLGRCYQMILGPCSIKKTLNSRFYHRLLNRTSVSWWHHS